MCLGFSRSIACIHRGAHPRKSALFRSEPKRFHPGRRTDRFKDAFRDIVGGKPSEGVAAARDEAIAATREAGEEVRERAERVAHAADISHRDKDKPGD